MGETHALAAGQYITSAGLPFNIVRSHDEIMGE
jgi:hypothetical protein